MRYLASTLLSFFLATGLTWAQGELNVFDIKTYHSSSGKYALTIDPDEENGQAGATYRFELEGKLLWQKHLPYCLIDVQLGNRGEFGGYGHPEPKTVGKKAEDSFLIVTGNREGAFTVRERVPIKSYIVDGPSVPNLLGTLYDPIHDEIAVLVTGELVVGEPDQQWYTYGLNETKPGPRLDPLKTMPGSRVVGVKDIPNSSLKLMSTITWSTDGKEIKGTPSVLLLDHAANPIWRLDVPDAFDLKGLPVEERLRVYWTSLIVAVRPGGFDLRLHGGREQVSYAIAEDSKPIVREMSRRSYVANKAPLVYPSIPVKRLSPTATIKLPLTRDKSAPGKGIADFLPLLSHRLAILYKGTPRSLVIADERGKIQRTISLPKGETVDHMALLSESRLLIFPDYVQTEEAKAWIVDFIGGKPVSVSLPAKTSIVEAAGLPDGGFVTIEETRVPFSSYETIVAHDLQGKIRWKIGGSLGYGGRPDEILSPESIAVDPKGQIVIFDLIRNAIKIFTQSGKFVSDITFGKDSNGEVPYSSDIQCLANGYLVADSNQIFRYDLTGKRIREITPRFHTQKPVGIARLRTADGRIWISNGEAISRLAPSFFTDRTIGPVGGSPGLHHIASVYVRKDGTIFAVDKSSDEIHVFTRSGTPKFTLQSPSRNENAERDRFSPRVAFDDLGRIYIFDGTKTARHSANGKLEAKFPNEQSGSSKSASTRPLGSWWFNTRLYSEKNAVVMRVDRLPNRKWLETRFLDHMAESPSGSLVFVTSAQPYRFRDWNDKATEFDQLSFYDRNGRPLSMADARVNLASIKSMAFDGKHVYVLIAEGLVALDKKGNPLWRLPLPPSENARQVFATSDGLVMFDGKATLYYYRP